MVFPVVPEEPTGKHRPQMILLLCSSVVGGHFDRMGILVGKVGPEMEELECAEKCGSYPEQDKIRRGDTQYIAQ